LRGGLVGLFLISRVYLLVVGAVYHRLAGLSQSLSTSFCSWDCDWYLELAQNGYAFVPQTYQLARLANWAFFPLYPLVFGGVAEVSGVSYLAAGYLVSNVCFFLALLVFYEYVRKTMEPNTAWWATVFLIFSPYSIYFATVYTESLFLLLSLLVFYFADREQWIPVGVSAALLSACRPTGILMVPVLMFMILRKYRWRELMKLQGPSASAVLALAMVPLGLAVYMTYLHGLMGDALAFSHVQVFWDREIGNPLRVLLNGIWNFRSKIGNFGYAMVTLAGLAVAVSLHRYKRTADAIFMGGAILVPLSTALYSMPRFVTGLFPAYIGVSFLLRDRASLRWAVLLLCIILNGILVVAWLQKRPFMV